MLDSSMQKTDVIKESKIPNPYSKKQSIILIILLLIFSLIFDFSIINNYGNLPGISVFIWEILFLIISYIFLNKTKKIDFILGIATFLAIIVSFRFSIFTNSFFIFSFLIIILYLNIFIMFKLQNYNSKNWWTLSGGLFSYFKLSAKVFDNIGEGLLILKSTIKSEEEKYLNKNTRVIILSIVILIIILFIVMPLLLSADKIFNTFFINFFDSLSVLKISYSDIFFRIIFTSIIFTIVWVLFLILPKITKIKPDIKEYKKINKLYGFIIIGGLNFIYILFAIVQFKYIFFGNHIDFRALNITYASYIHSGFYQLIAVAFINFILYKVFYKRSKNEKDGINLYSKINYLLLLILTIIICFSALTRIILYIDAYSMTELRFFVVYITMIILGFYFLNVINLLKENVTIFKTYYILVLVSFVCLGYFNIDKYIANYNLNNGGKSLSKMIDYRYILTLSNDAIEEKKKAYILYRNELKNELNKKYSIKLIDKNLELEYFFYYNYYNNKTVILLDDLQYK